jgi:hypothetical protein
LGDISLHKGLKQFFRLPNRQAAALVMHLNEYALRSHDGV